MCRFCHREEHIILRIEREAGVISTPERRKSYTYKKCLADLERESRVMSKTAK